MCKRGGSKTYLVGAGLVGDLPDTEADERHVLLVCQPIVHLRPDAPRKSYVAGSQLHVRDVGSHFH